MKLSTEKKNNSESNCIFTHDNKEITNPMEIANRFCYYFSNIGPNLEKQIRQLPNSTSPISYLPCTDQSLNMCLEPVTEDEIIKITNEFLKNKAAGHDNIPMSMIQLTIQVISKPLLHIINLSFTSGIVPSYLKISRIIPSFKSGDKSIFGNYRPISILPAFSKSFEKAYYNRLANYLHKSNILSNDQYGFRKGYSTSYALIDLRYLVHLTTEKLQLVSFVIFQRHLIR